MRSRPLKTALAVGLVATQTGLAGAGVAAPGLTRLLEDSSQALTGARVSAQQLPAPQTPPASPVRTVPLEQEQEEINYSYGEIINHLEQFNRPVTVGRGRRRRRITVNTGVLPGSRPVNSIRKIVLHASMGVVGNVGCAGTVRHLLNATTAAHFMVCRDGQVTRMVRIENVANHIRNDALEREAVGIETESGHPRAPIFREEDWSPALQWRMYASLAMLIRAISRETGMPRDRAHIVTHEEADRAFNGHTDPGPIFEGHVYSEFGVRFPGQSVTPREYLMRLVLDDSPPQIWNLVSPGMPPSVQARDTEGLGLAHLRVWALAGNQATVKMAEWQAALGAMPAAAANVQIPTQPGQYRVVARDLVGNTRTALLQVAPPAPGSPGPAIALFDEPAIFLSEPPMRFAASEDGVGSL